MGRDSSLPTSNFYNIQSGATASSPRTATWAPIGNTSQALTSTLASASFNTPLATGISPRQYGGGNTNSSKPDVNDIAYNVDAELNYNFGPIKTTYLGSVRQYNAKENGNALIGQRGTPWRLYPAIARTASGQHGAGSAENSGRPLLLPRGIAHRLLHLQSGACAFGNTYIYGFPQHTISATKGLHPGHLQGDRYPPDGRCALHRR
jgi:iron complex outermembrane receptor protein